MVLKTKYLVILAVVDLILLLLYMFDWMLEDSLEHFLLFVFGVVIFFILNGAVLYYLIFRREIKAIIILLISSLYFLLPLKQLYAMYYFKVNRNAMNMILEKYKSNKLKKVLEQNTKLSVFQIPEKLNGGFLRSSKIYVYKECVFFPVFSYENMISYCTRQPQSIFSELGYKNLYKLDKNVYWVRFED